MTGEIHTGEEGGVQDTSLINCLTSVGSSMPSCHTSLMDGHSLFDSRGTEVAMANFVCVSVRVCYLKDGLF